MDVSDQFLVTTTFALRENPCRRQYGGHKKQVQMLWRMEKYPCCESNHDSLVKQPFACVEA
jgi:hypothetical protein